jgi:hypothetical protein
LFQIYFIAVTFLIVARQHGNVEVGSLRWLSTEVRWHPFDPSDLPWAVSQRPFDPYRAGAKVYRVYQASGRAGSPPHKQPWNAYVMKGKRELLTNFKWI